ncbi:HalOD1 output domain-containing protein [Halobaculum marinum]|uniref:HalOD1 output domain-containing protein n=1 Tax=Halobaculum marinum TaxID=3031996 RepID=A0ABD5X7A3_9EURY|nr:HalOD1 output domain-containing protein [Halobaculum sp. DT55]
MAKDSAEESDSMDATPSDSATKESVPQDVGWDLVEQRSFDVTADDGLTTTIVYAVAEAEGIAPRDLKHPPLFDVVDTASLEAAFFGNHDNRRSHDPNSSTEFMYRDYRVVVRSDGWVQVYERSGE